MYIIHLICRYCSTSRSQFHSYEELFSSYWYHVRRLVYVAKQPSGGCLLACVTLYRRGFSCFTHLGNNSLAMHIHRA